MRETLSEGLLPPLPLLRGSRLPDFLALHAELLDRGALLPPCGLGLRSATSSPAALLRCALARLLGAPHANAGLLRRWLRPVVDQIIQTLLLRGDDPIQSDLPCEYAIGRKDGAHQFVCHVCSLSALPRTRALSPHRMKPKLVWGACDIGHWVRSDLRYSELGVDPLLSAGFEWQILSASPVTT